MQEQRELLERALGLLSQGRVSPAKALCRKALHRYPATFDGLHLLGVLHLKDQQYAQASKALHQALELPAPRRQQAQVCNNLALSLLYQGDLDAALSAVQTALQRTPDSVAFLLNCANIEEARENWPGMLQALDRAASQPAGTSPEIDLGRAVALRKSTGPEPALCRLLDWKETCRDYLELQLELLLLLGLNLGVEDAMCHSDTLTGQWPDIHLRLADYSAEENYPDLALPFYRAALDRDPGNPAIHHMLDALTGEPRSSAPPVYVSSLYDSHAARFEQQLVGRLGYHLPDQLPQWLQLGQHSALGEVLDLGCGTGLAGQALKRHSRINHLTGVDLSREMLALAKKKQCYDQLEHQELRAFLEQQKAARYQLITALDVLIYLGDLRPLFEQVARTLAPGGRFLFSVECAEGAGYRLQTTGRFQHSEAYLSACAQQAGLHWVRCEPVALRKERGQIQSGRLVLLKKSN